MSHSSVAMCLKCAGIVIDKLTANLMCSLPCKNF